MRTIWKFVLAEPVTTVRMPIDRKILAVQTQDGLPVVWAEVDPTTPEIDRTFACVPTGGHLPEKIMNYIGTVQTPSRVDPETLETSNYVWHIYEIIG
jgi:hypothetical protein